MVSMPWWLLVLGLMVMGSAMLADRNFAYKDGHEAGQLQERTRRNLADLARRERLRKVPPLVYGVRVQAPPSYSALMTAAQEALAARTAAAGPEVPETPAVPVCAVTGAQEAIPEMIP